MSVREPTYCNINDVYEECGMDEAIVREMSGRTSAQVQTRINQYIFSAERKVNDKLGVPKTVHREYHKATGEDDEYDLGFDDELGYHTIEISQRVVGIHGGYLGGVRKKLPYPRNCDLCEKAEDWAGVTSNCTVTDDQAGSLLTENASIDDISITVANGSLFEDGDRILIQDDNGEQFCVVDRTDGNTVWLTSELRRAFTTVANAIAIGPIISGRRTIRFVFGTNGGSAIYPRTNANHFINKNIDIYDFMSLKVLCSSASAVLSIRLYDNAGNFNYVEFSVARANEEYFLSWDLDEDFTGNIDWDDTNLYYLELRADRACTVSLDNLNFNDEWFITAPRGILCIPRQSSDDPAGEGYPFHVTYSYNPYLHEVPWQVRDATAKFAAVKLLNYLIGIRLRDIGFAGEGESAISRPDRDQMLFTRSRLERELKDIIKEIGYGFEFVPLCDLD